ncbi:OmpA family protein [Marinobacter sp.]|uniref:OmpA family protein n=1 Tax=Marinobacter sp. TaxID=50741 RepID=UPI003A8D2C95
MHKITLLIFTLFCAAMNNQALANTDSHRDPVSSTVSVSFDSGDSTFQADPTNRAILDAAKTASMVIVSGRTSTDIPSKRDEMLALKRALSARDYLVSQGVSPLKIMLNYASASDYRVDNDTPEGKYINQRVDIKIIYVPKY